MVNFFLGGGGVVVGCRGVIKEKSPDFRFPEVGISVYMWLNNLFAIMQSIGTGLANLCIMSPYLHG